MIDNTNRKKNADGVWEITPDEVCRHMDEVTIIDVRRHEEFTGELGHIPGARLSTLQTEFPEFVKTLDKDETYVFVCRSGKRSSSAAELAMELGIMNCYNMEGGMIAWKDKDHPISREDE